MLEGFDVLNPNEVWETNTYSNNLYKIVTADGRCLGTFLPTDKQVKVSSLTGLAEATINDYITGTDGCNAPQYSEMYGVGTIFSGPLIKNNTPYPVYIYRLDKQGVKILPGKLLASNETLSVEALSNTLFQIANTDGNCLGIFFPKSTLQYVSDLSILNQSSINDYKTGPGSCSLNQRSGQYGVGKTISGSFIRNDTSQNVTVQWINEAGNIQQDGIVLRPGDEWNASSITNYVYKLVTDAGVCLGVFLPKEGETQKVSELSNLESAGLNDYITGTAGCSSGQRSQMYGTSNPISGQLLINDTSQPLKIYLIDKDGKEVFTENNNSHNGGVEPFDVILPGEVWTKDTQTNFLYKIKTESDVCLGTFLPSPDVLKISQLTGLQPDTSTPIEDKPQSDLPVDFNKYDTPVSEHAPPISGPINQTETTSAGMNNTMIIGVLIIMAAVIMGFVYSSMGAAAVASSSVGTSVAASTG